MAGPTRRTDGVIEVPNPAQLRVDRAVQSNHAASDAFCANNGASYLWTMPVRRSAFVLARWSIVLATIVAVGSALLYPGGTLHDPSRRGYSLVENFLSDLGMTIAYDGRPNGAGAILFVLGLCVVVLGLGRALLEFVRLYATSPSARPYALAASIVGLLVSSSFIGVGFTPENRVLDLHVQFTFFAFRVFPLLTLLLAVASFKSIAFPRSVGVAWVVLTVVLATYAVILTWGPTVATPAGLMTQVIAQKMVAITAGGFFFYLCRPVSFSP